MKTTIIGAGISGLWVAHQLTKANNDITLFEKSKGVGGRMATKRIGSEKFDHGAQFYSDNLDMKDLHQIWLAAEITSPWFIKKEILRYRSHSGVTALAKNLGQNLNIQFNKKITSVQKTGPDYRLNFDDNSIFETQRLILTSPVPQSLEILKSSHIHYPSDLEHIHYAKAVVLLIEHVTTETDLVPESGYFEDSDSDIIFSIADQQKKNNCVHKSWTITMSTAFSEKYFNESDQTILDIAIAEVIKLIPEFKFTAVTLKKWRYSHPKNTYSQLFLKLENENIFLAGDAFGGPSISGAVRSANALIQYLKHDSKKN